MVIINCNDGIRMMVVMMVLIRCSSCGDINCNISADDDGDDDDDKVGIERWPTKDDNNTEKGVLDDNDDDGDDSYETHCNDTRYKLATKIIVNLTILLKW